MTPFGARLRRLRAERGVTLKAFAAALHVSAAYVSALEHGRRGVPQPGLVRQVCDYFGLIWADADALALLAGLSAPRAVVDTAGLGPDRTLLANTLARRIGTLDAGTVARMQALLDSSPVAAAPTGAACGRPRP